MKRTLAGAVVLAAVSQEVVAQLGPDPPLTRHGWEVGAQAAHYEYREPNVVKLAGNRLGILGAYTFTGAHGLFSKIDVRQSYGRLKYEGSGTQNNVPDLIIETRAVVGSGFRAGGSVSLSPYSGLGYRYLYSNLQGYSSTGAVGYRRYSNYLYAPIGLTARVHFGGGWVLAPTVEVDVFILGRQVSKLSDTGLGYGDVTNRQDKGRGHRASLMVEKNHWAVGAWAHYWHISHSDTQPIGLGQVGREPENYTREGGLEVRYRF